MKILRIDDYIHAQLKREAQAEGRTLQWLVEYKLTNGGKTSPAPGTWNEAGQKTSGAPHRQEFVEEVTVIEDNQEWEETEAPKPLNTKKALESKGLKFCPAGHLILSSGKCAQKGCTYA